MNALICGNADCALSNRPSPSVDFEVGDDAPQIDT
jgi:hypothetical protein